MNIALNLHIYTRILQVESGEIQKLLFIAN